MIDIAPTTRLSQMVLIVDDDPLAREIMGHHLQKAGYQIECASNGLEAMQYLEKNSYDVAIIDLSMPGLDGFGLLDQLRTIPAHQHLPVIVVTGSDDPRSIEEAYRHGATSFTAKPVNWVQFLYHVRFVERSGAIARSLHQAESNALAASRFKNSMFQVLSHELKTPISALLGFTTLLRESLASRVGPLEAEQLDHVLHASQRLHQMVNDVLTLSNALAKLGTANREETSIAAIVDDSVVSMRSLARQHALVLSVTDLPEMDDIWCDRGLIIQALQKLIDNAIKFSPSGASITVGAKVDKPDLVIFSVTDQGPGMSDTKLAACLEPFMQSDMTYGRPVEGLGLGLAIAKAVAEAHRGILVIKTQEGCGLRAELHLPQRGPEAA